MKKTSWQQWVSLLTCLLMMLAVAIRRDGQVLGHDLTGKSTARPVTVTADTVPTLRTSGDTLIVNTTYIGRDIKGYAGRVPMEVSVLGGKVVAVKALKNTETEDFFHAAFRGLKAAWTGKTVEEAARTVPDAVSGATFSSRAIIGNVQLALQEAASDSSASGASSASWRALMSPKAIAGLLVALMAAVLPLFVRNKKYHTVQLVLNVLVLGFWCGTFVSYTLIVRFLSSGLNVWLYLVPIILLVVAFVYPLFGKRQYYCTHVCPFGSLQQLAGMCNRNKLSLGKKTVKRLDVFRQVLWAVLMLCLWSGVLFEWMDYELFTAFLFQSASWIVIVAAALFIVLSFFIQRPYCRFVCPTGSLLKIV